MHNFVNSIKPAQPVSNIVSKHYRLFQIFYEVALRYTELKSASNMEHDDYPEVSTEIDNYLSALGFQAPIGMNEMAGSASVSLNENSCPVSTEASANSSKELLDADPASRLPAWFHVSQQMMGLVDNEEMPF